ncbi:MAG: LON peptidase substrate-binding domain-containing protein [Parvularculaceae bacterium]
MNEPTPSPRGRSPPHTIPVFPLSGAMLLPGGQLPLNIFEPRYLRMIDDALGGARVIGMVQPRNQAGGPSPPLYAVGGAGRITAFSETDDGRYLITLTGIRRFRIVDELETDAPYRQARVDWSAFASDGAPDASAEFVDRERLLHAMRRYLDAEGLKTDWDSVKEAPTEALVGSLAMGCPFAPNEKQALLEAETTLDRAECLTTLMEMSGAGEGGDENSTLQ